MTLSTMLRRFDRGARARLGLAGLAGVTGAAALTCALSLSGVATPLGPHLAPVNEQRADAALQATTPDLEAAVRHSRATLATAPLTASAWLRLAWLADQAGRPAERDALIDRSYAAAPFGPDVTAIRLWFLFERWTTLPAELRRQALSEVEATLMNRPTTARSLADQIADPSGQMAYRMTLQVLDAQAVLAEAQDPSNTMVTGDETDALADTNTAPAMP